jgi:DNA-binding GntR family transcriptional regulator
MSEIENTTGFTLYRQIAEQMRKDILKLDYGERIPTEEELISQYNVSRGTVRKAVDFLVKEGYVYKIHGKGTFRGLHTQSLKADNEIYSYTKGVQKRGGIPIIENVRLETVKANEEVARALIIPIGKKVYRLSRYRGERSEGIYRYSEAYILMNVTPKLKKEDLQLSLIDMLVNKFKIKMSRTESDLSVALMKDLNNDRLPKQLDRAVMIDHFTVFDKNGRPIVLDISYSWSKSYKYHLESRISDEAEY